MRTKIENRIIEDFLEKKISEKLKNYMLEGIRTIKDEGLPKIIKAMEEMDARIAPDGDIGITLDFEPGSKSSIKVCASGYNAEINDIYGAYKEEISEDQIIAYQNKIRELYQAGKISEKIMVYSIRTTSLLIEATEGNKEKLVEILIETEEIEKKRGINE